MICQNPRVFSAVNPLYACQFFIENGRHGFVVLASVVLVITGGEALYADMGHFGRKPIRFAWFVLVFPSLLLNYFGQGALLLGDPSLAANPFYGLVPRNLLYPMVALSTVATVIASQAMITGVFSLTRQAVQLGFCPRVHIIHTSHETQGQIYIPVVNTLMMVACIALVLVFRESSRLASAYGIAVTADMAITSMIYFFVIVKTWKWPFGRAVFLILLFAIFDLTYFGSNLSKVMDGGWFPLVVALLIVVAMTTWKRGRKELGKRISDSMIPLDLFLKDVAKHQPHRVEGTAVFMSSFFEGSPPTLLHHFKHNQVLHKQVALLSIQVADIPYVHLKDQLYLEDLGQGFYRLIARFGFMQTPHVPEIMRRAYRVGLVSNPASTTYFLGRETLLTSGLSKMSQWRKKLFAFFSRNAANPTAYFGIPPGRVVELGIQINL
jgi:KUP system potassium uptake protein